ncbi:MULTISPECIES: hypothetical protein [unclassified Saccharibacter]|uniref:hypothetical protein n=1 Tax=unclassified Saccharibacter TaxID=2648722 RepID=UPI0013287FB6|nr:MULTISPECIES: hypothetical protein [unclassified Saccharibacter]MXV36324.1 hypothetical protein [Saccharibacter sp. EH611]MXV57183.1 hypothetical protein [Saccharibacter sp. EH70]MXV66457.1 hypothetical protein [Saccharibacter sp. EH60]
MSRYWKGRVFLGMMGIACVIGSSAHADRVLTDYEASKLTFSALIAPPSHYYHAAQKRKKATTMRLARLHRKGSAIRTVAYHGHVISRHKRNTHHRRG